MKISSLQLYPACAPITFIRQDISRKVIVGVFLGIIEYVRHYLRIVSVTELIPRDESQKRVLESHLHFRHESVIDEIGVFLFHLLMWYRSDVGVSEIVIA